jgi:hypothetical protein
MQRPKGVDKEDWNLLQGELKQFQNTTMTPQQLQNARPEDLGNSVEMEMQWAEKAFRHAETYMKLLHSIEDHSKLRLTKYARDFKNVTQREIENRVLLLTFGSTIAFCHQNRRRNLHSLSSRLPRHESRQGQRGSLEVPGLQSVVASVLQSIQRRSCQGTVYCST